VTELSYREQEGVELLKRLYASPETPIAVDTETTGLGVYAGTAYCIGVSIAGVLDGAAFSHYFAVAHPTGVNVSRETSDMLEWVLAQPDRLLIFANVQFDIRSLETISGQQLDSSNFIDICTMAHYVDENTPKSKSLESLGQHYIGEGKVSDEYVDYEKITGNQNITPEEMWDYAVRDAVVTWRVWYQLLDHPVWTALPENIWPDKQRLIRVLIEMKRRGVRIDPELAQEYVTKGEIEMRRLGELLGYPAPMKPTKANPRQLPVLGPKALEDLFIKRLGLPVVKRTATGRISFDKDAMGEYDEMLERVEGKEASLVKEYRGWQKAVSAAYRPYLELVDPDGRLRCSYKTHGTVTGRLSCSEPNLQQIPKETDKPWNGKVKECFIAKEGYTLINADFSQLELRLIVAYSGEPSLRQVFEEDRDIFNEMSRDLGWERSKTKLFVYATNYGAGPKKHARTFGITEAEARWMVRRYKQTYPEFAGFQARCQASAERSKQIRMWSGRYRHFEYESQAFKAMNSVIQGGAADIVERVMTRCFEELDNPDCEMLLQVHDSITWEVRSDLVEEYMPKIKAVMEDVEAAVGHDLFKVKWAVDVGYWSAREAAKHEEVAA
jgi:DNA polymerase-1